MNTSKHIIIDGDAIEIRQSEAHEYLVTTKEVARGYGSSESAIREHKRNHADELLVGVHWITCENPGVRNPDAGQRHGNETITMWTKLGVITLGFFIRTERAKRFRAAAAQIILRITGGQAAPVDGHSALASAMALLAKTLDRQSETIGRLTLGQYHLQVRADLADERLRALENENIRKMREAMQPYQPRPFTEEEALAEALRLTLGFEALKEVQAAAIVATIRRYELPVSLSEKQPANSLAKRLIKLAPDQHSRDGLGFTVAHKGRNRHRRYILRRGAIGRAETGSPTY